MESRHMTGVVLAGGEGKRLGRDKAEIVIESESLIETIISKLKTSFEEILIITLKNKYAHYAHRFAHLGYRPVSGSIGLFDLLTWPALVQNLLHPF